MLEASFLFSNLGAAGYLADFVKTERDYIDEGI